MARKRVVSRTIKTTIVTALATDILEAKVAQLVVSVGGNLKGKELEKAVKKQIEREDYLKFNCILETHIEECTYAMPEEQFLAFATKVEK